MKFRKSFMSLLVFMLLFVFVGCGSDNGGGGFSEGEPISNISDEVQARFGANPNKVDTDGDGLTDDFEILQTYPYHLPDNNDTDGNGILDSKEDYDKDGLSALEEQLYKTNPLLSDSDNDGLSDKDEIQIYKTNPLLVDTDEDNLSDKFEISVGLNPLKKDSDDNGILDNDELIKQKSELNIDSKNAFSVEMEAKGNLSKKIIISEISNLNPNFTNIANQVSKTYSLTVNNNVKNYILKFKLDSSKVIDENDLKLFVFDNELSFWIPIQTIGKSIIDNGDGTLTFSSIVNNEIKVSSKIFKSQKETQYLEKNVHYYMITSDGFLSGGGMTTSKVCIPSDKVNKDTDIVFVIDSSGSMSTNDPSDIRIDASKDFLSAFSDASGDKIGDRGAVVDFDSGATLYQSLTQDKALLEIALNNIDSNGGTNIGAGVNLAINELLGADNLDKNHKVIILLTDGEGSYDVSLTQKAKDNNIRILTIGLSSNVDNQLLFDIANETGGVYKQINSSSELTEVFKNFEKTLGDDGSDSDGDGLSDCAEYLGMFLNNGMKIVTDPNNPDTDGDGIPDGEEIYKASHSDADLEARAKAILKQYNDSGMYVTDEDKDTFENILKYGLYSVKSYPNKIDSDNDDLDDAKELELGSDAFSNDTDGDTLTDIEEISYNTSLFLKDTDEDTLTDIEEITDGTNPTIFDEVYDGYDYAGLTVLGFVCGDAEICDKKRDNVAYFAGHMLSGFVLIGDLRDLPVNAINGKWVDTVFSAVGFIPGVGDSIKIGKTLIKTLKSSKNPARTIANIMKNTTKIHDSAYIYAIKNFWKDSYDTLISKGLSDTKILQIAKGGKPLDDLAYALKNATVKNLPDVSNLVSTFKLKNGNPVDAFVKDGFFYGKHNGLLAEHILTKGVTKWEPRSFIVEYVNTAGKTRKGRRVPDFFDKVTRTAHESKTGYTKLTTRIKRQIDDDIELLNNNDNIAEIVWNFFPSGRSNSLGASQELLKKLENAGIKYVIHLP